MKVCKFGGSSLADAKQIRKVCSIILADTERRVVVVSAPGKRFPDDIKITDQLIALSNAISSGYDGKREIAQIVKRYRDIAVDLGLDAAFGEHVEQDLLGRIEANREQTRDLNDALKAAGEDLCARLVSRYLSANGQDAVYVSPCEAGLNVHSIHGHTRVLPESYANIHDCLSKQNGLVIFPGFFACGEGGKIRTFSRGGSDITGAILAAAMHATVYENWTDVDSVYAVSPKLIDNPLPIKEISYAEMRELAYAGFSVLHEEALEPTAAHEIPVHIRNTNNPHLPGSRIVSSHRNFDSVVTGIAGRKGFVLLHMSRYLMNREVGFAVKVLQILADFNIPFEHMPSGIDSITIVLKEEFFPPEKEKLVLERIQQEVVPDSIHIRRNIAVIMLVGDAMAQTVGVTARAATALSRAGVNLELIIQSESEISIIFGIKDTFCNYAVKELYKEFFLR